MEFHRTGLNKKFHYKHWKRTPSFTARWPGWRDCIIIIILFKSHKHTEEFNVYFYYTTRLGIHGKKGRKASMKQAETLYVFW